MASRTAASTRLNFKRTHYQPSRAFLNQQGCEFDDDASVELGPAAKAGVQRSADFDDHRRGLEPRCEWITALEGFRAP